MQVYTGDDPRHHSYVWFSGVLDRIYKLRRTLPGGGVSAQELQLEAAAERMKAAQEESPTP